MFFRHNGVTEACRNGSALGRTVLNLHQPWGSQGWFPGNDRRIVSTAYKPEMRVLQELDVFETLWNTCAVTCHPFSFLLVNFLLLVWRWRVPRVRDTNTDKRSRKVPSSSCWWLQISEHQQVRESVKAPVAAQEPYFHWHNPTGTTSCSFLMFLLYFPCWPNAVYRYPGSNSYRFSC